jgi:hypothetical protein
VVNINPDGNDEVLHRSETLGDYSEFVERVRSYQSQGFALRDAIRGAVKWGIENGVLSSFLEQNGSEVENMLYTEFNIDVAKVVWQEEARLEGEARGEARGKAEGEARGKAEVAKRLLSKNLLIDDIVDATGLTREEIEKLRN